MVFDPAAHPNGDKGGNAIRLGEHRNLHALWDAAPDASPEASYDPGESFDERYNRAYVRALKQVDLLLADADLNAQGKKAAQEKDPKQWVRESFDLAKEKVYVPEIRKQILAADGEQKHAAEDDHARPSCSCNCPTATGTAPRTRQAAGGSGRLSHGGVLAGPP